MKLTLDQMMDFDRIKEAQINNIITESAFTQSEIEQTLILLKKNEDYNFYLFLRRHPGARAIRTYLTGLTRRPTDRVKEADRAKADHLDSSDLQNIKNKLGLSQEETKDKVIEVLRRLKDKSSATWKALNLNKKKVLEEYGID